MDNNEYNMKAQALSEAVKAHKNGESLPADEVVARATAYYSFLKESK